MVIEYIRYTIPIENAKEFEAAYAKAGAILHSSEHCQHYEISRGIEEPEHYIIRIDWKSLEGHEQGFRTSPDFGAFFEAVGPFFNQITEMKHYQIVTPE